MTSPCEDTGAERRVSSLSSRVGIVVTFVSLVVLYLVVAVRRNTAELTSLQRDANIGGKVIYGWHLVWDNFMSRTGFNFALGLKFHFQTSRGYPHIGFFNAERTKFRSGDSKSSVHHGCPLPKSFFPLLKV